MSLARKLQVPAGAKVRVVHAPAGFQLDAPTTDGAVAEAVLVFVKNAKELRANGKPAFEAAREDRLSWIAYPKGGQLGTDLNRDKLWAAVKAEKIKPVRQVALDATWSALRFRPA
ncbi:MAG TPA: hypothetical protein VGR28_06900 [Candidatus Thermoplasmatota archaeon]|jgi:hypothetical protein|nr:hypothetical protein [Candidatus Thermoplasmatota archaeon]